MIRTISDEKLRLLAHKAKNLSTEPGDYYDRSSLFLRGLLTRNEVSMSEHNWLSQLRASLTEVGDR